MFQSPFRGLGEEERKIPAGTIPAVENYYLLVIGIDEYANGFGQLNNAVSDAKKVAAKLTGKYRFAEDKVSTLYAAAATQKAIIAEATKIYQQTGPDDAVLIYFAGHGIYGRSEDQYYLVAANSDPQDVKDKTYTSLVSLAAICGKFKKYDSPEGKKCRDLLVILDACYSGGAVEGWGGSQHNEPFSRHILTSSLKEQPAEDGIKGRGSAFANAFIDTLDANDQNFYSFAAMAPVFESKFARSDLKIDEAQTIAFDKIPNMQTGRGSFIFEKKEKERPDLHRLKESLIDYLDFTEQRGDLENYYLPHISQLNIVTTQGHSFNVQKLLAKVIFRDLSKLYKLDFASGHCYARERINLDLDPAGDIWQQLYKQIKDDQVREDKETIHHWFFDKLLSDEEEMHEKRHVVLWISLRLAGTGIFKAIENFCQEFSTIFLRAFAALPPAEQKKRGKMFIVIADEREQPADSHQDLFRNIFGNSQYNFIPTRKIKDINTNHTRKWLNSFPDENLSQKILELKNEEVYNKCIGIQNLRYEDFIEKICTHCVFSRGEIEKLQGLLYDFNNNSLF